MSILLHTLLYSRMQIPHYLLYHSLCIVLIISVICFNLAIILRQLTYTLLLKITQRVYSQVTKHELLQANEHPHSVRLHVLGTSIMFLAVNHYFLWWSRGTVPTLIQVSNVTTDVTTCCYSSCNAFIILKEMGFCHP